jgi:hypothetical protein
MNSADQIFAQLAARLSLPVRQTLRHLRSLCPTNSLIHRTARSSSVENKEGESSTLELAFGSLHKQARHAASPVCGFHEDVEHVASPVGSWVKGMRRPLDLHQADAGNGHAIRLGYEAEIAAVRKARRKPTPEGSRHGGKLRLRTSGFPEHLFAVAAHEIQIRCRHVTQVDHAPSLSRTTKASLHGWPFRIAFTS